MGIQKQLFGKSLDNREVFLYEMTNKNRMSIAVTDFGATLVKVLVPDRQGVRRDVVLGYDDAEGYYNNPGHFGAVVGRNGNRIKDAKFTINGKEYQLAVNDNKNNLHSSQLVSHPCMECYRNQGREKQYNFWSFKSGRGSGLSRQLYLLCHL